MSLFVRKDLDALLAEAGSGTLRRELGALALVTLGIGALLTVPLMILVGIAWLVFTIIAAMKANNGERYRYPLTLRLVK